jgi:NAD-dependent deacetylase
MKELTESILSSEYCVALTGAGISTLSGIKDFRGKDGFYKQKQIDADKIFDLSYFLSDPSYYYMNTKEFIYNLEEKQPNIVHRTLAKLEKQGILKATITQNIDILHQKAGSKKVIEVHGSPKEHNCLDCGKKYSYEEIQDCLRKNEVPYCNSCQGIIKPQITFFGECLDETALTSASREAEKADLMLVLGSSLQVQPAASIPLYTLQNGGKLIIVNNMSTPLDPYAKKRYGSLEECFECIDKALAN